MMIYVAVSHHRDFGHFKGTGAFEPPMLQVVQVLEAVLSNNSNADLVQMVHINNHTGRKRRRWERSSVLRGNQCSGIYIYRT